jgi:hypothetical protein
MAHELQDTSYAGPAGQGDRTGGQPLPTGTTSQHFSPASQLAKSVSCRVKAWRLMAVMQVVGPCVWRRWH